MGCHRPSSWYGLHANTASSTFFLLEVDRTFSDDERARLLLLPSDRLRPSDSPRPLLFDLDWESLPMEDGRLELDRLERLALIFRCIMARLFRRFVNRIPRNIKRLPTRHNEPSVYLARLAKLKLAKVCPAEDIAPIDFA